MNKEETEDNGKVELPRWSTVQQASGYVGCSRFTLYRWIEKGILPCGRLGRAIRIDLNQLDALIRSCQLGNSEARSS